MSSKRRHRAIPLAMLPTRQAASRAALAGLLGVSALTLILSRTPHPSVMEVRARIGDALLPVVDALASPVHAVERAGAWLAELSVLRTENQSLKNAHAELSQWQAAARKLEAENQALRKLLHTVPAGAASYVSAHIVSDSGSPYVHSALISAGAENGVKKDEAVVSGHGLLGRVMEVGQTSARVLLLTDINSRVPVIGEVSRERAIMVGDNSPITSLAYVSSDSKLAVGERMVTSGDGGLFPAGIPVGVVSAVENGKVKAVPLADWRQVEYVTVVDYTF